MSIAPTGINPASPKTLERDRRFCRLQVGENVEKKYEATRKKYRPR